MNFDSFVFESKIESIRLFWLLRTEILFGIDLIINHFGTPEIIIIIFIAFLAMRPSFLVGMPRLDLFLFEYHNFMLVLVVLSRYETSVFFNTFQSMFIFYLIF